MYMDKLEPDIYIMFTVYRKNNPIIIMTIMHT